MKWCLRQAGDTIREAGGTKFVVEAKPEAAVEKVIYNGVPR